MPDYGSFNEALVEYIEPQGYNTSYHSSLSLNYIIDMLYDPF